MADKMEKPVCTFSFKKRGRVKNTRKRKSSDDEGSLLKINEFNSTRKCQAIHMRISNAMWAII